MKIRGLYIIINKVSQSPMRLIELAQQVLEGGANVIQYRDKKISQESIETANEICRLCKQYSVPFLMNDYVSLVEEVGADGVHIGQEDMGVKEARRILGDAIIGVTVSNAKEALIADDADYLGCGHVFPTNTKKKKTPPIGLDGLQSVVDSVSKPIVAIGGITIDSVSEVMDRGAAAVAMVSAVEQHRDPIEACREIQRALECGIKSK